MTTCTRGGRPCAAQDDRVCPACADAAVAQWARQLGRLVQDLCLGRPGTWTVAAADPTQEGEA